MKPLYECRAIVERQWQVLHMEYGNFYNRASYDQMVRRCVHLEPPIFEEAIARHIADATEESPGRIRGKWPPKTADIMAQAHKIREEQRVKEQNDRFESNATYLALKDGQRLEMPKSHCPECSDRGTTCFYYDPQNKSRVWLRSQLAEIDDLTFQALATGSAVCDCTAGKSRYERQWTYEHHGKIFYTMPRLEHLRTKVRQLIPQPHGDGGYFS